MIDIKACDYHFWKNETCTRAYLWKRSKFGARATFCKEGWDEILKMSKEREFEPDWKVEKCSS